MQIELYSSAVSHIKLLRDVPLQAYVPEDKLVHVQRVVYGLNLGKPVEELSLDEAQKEAAQQLDFDLRTAVFKAAPEQMRPPRIVRIGLVQNQIVLPTTAPYAEQAKVCTCMSPRPATMISNTCMLSWSSTARGCAFMHAYVACHDEHLVVPHAGHP